MNDSQADAYELTGPCNQGIVSNVGAGTTAAIDDPLNTVYAQGGTFSRQVWWKMMNSTGSQAYARFVLTNISASPIDIAAAVYLEDPAATARPSVRSAGTDASVTWQIPLDVGQTVSVGTAIPDGETIWLEIAGDDTEGDGDGWNGPLQLSWQLLEATFFDAPDSYEGTTEFVSGFLPSVISGVTQQPLSYCRMDDLNFAAIGIGASNEFDIYVWTDGGGSPTNYPITDALIGLGIITSSIAKPYGPAAPQIRTDGTNVWVVAYLLNSNSITVAGTPIAAHQWTPAVWWWNGAGFDFLGSATPQCFPWRDQISNITYLQQIGMVSAAACTAEAGVLHIMWSESGADNVDTVTGAIITFGSFVHYSQWSSTTETASGDPLSSSALGTSPSSLTPYTSSYLFVTNAFGDLVSFYGYPDTLGLTSASQAGNITYTDLIEMWSVDETTGAKTLLQAANGSTLLGTSATLDASSFTITVGGTRQPPQDTFGGDDTFFFSFPFSVPARTQPLLNVDSAGANAIVVTTPSISPAVVFEDVYDDSRNIWLGGAAIQSTSLTCPTGTSAFDGSAFNIFLSGGDVDRLELFYDDGDDVFYTLGIQHGSPDEISPVKVPILRDYLICGVSPCPGLFIWSCF